MSFVSQFITEIRPQIDRAVATALPDLAQGLKKKIKEKAQSEVYSYDATPSAMAKRRGTIGEPSGIAAHYGEYSVELVNERTMQGGMGHEVEMVEEGWENFRQPGPRPFMDEALNEYVDSGEAGQALVNALRAYGFVVT